MHDWFCVRPSCLAPILFLYGKWLWSQIFGSLVLGFPCHMIYLGCVKVFQRASHPSPGSPSHQTCFSFLNYSFHPSLLPPPQSLVLFRPHHGTLCKLKETNQSELTAEHFSSSEWKCYANAGLPYTLHPSALLAQSLCFVCCFSRCITKAHSTSGLGSE